MENLRIIHIHTCGSDYTPSGGDKCMMELIHHFSLEGVQQEAVLGFRSPTPLLGKGLSRIEYFIDHIIDMGHKSKLFFLVLYFRLFIKSFFHLRRYPAGTIFISHFDGYPNMFYSFLLKILNPGSYWFAFNHMLVPEKKFNNNSLPIRIYNRLNECLFFILQKKADLLISVNSIYIPVLKKNNPNVLIIPLGREFGLDREPLPSSNRKYDLVFMGRFDPQKGIEQIPGICQHILELEKDKKRRFSMLLIGLMNPAGRKLSDELSRLSGQMDFHFSGFIPGEERFRLLEESRVCIFPSHYESFGIVYLDAISVGTPVVEYDLPYFNDHKGGVVKVPYLDNREFASRALELINNNDKHRQLSLQGLEYSSGFTWDKASELILNKIRYYKNQGLSAGASIHE